MRRLEKSDPKRSSTCSRYESVATPTSSTSPSSVPGWSRSASISSSCSSVSFWPSRSKNFTPLYSGGLCEAVITQPRSTVRSATCGAGTTPATTAFPPADAMPRASASSSSTPDARVSRPTMIRPWPDHSVAARPRRSTRLAVRSSPTTPRTPSVPKYWRAKLPLAELRRFAGLVEPGLLALDDSSVAREKACALQRYAQFGVGLDERPRDAVTDGSGLPARPTAVHAHADVVGSLDACHLQRRQRDRAVRLPREVILNRAAVEPGGAVAGSQDHPRDGGLALARSAVLRDRAHASSQLSGFGACGLCGCSGPT